MTLWLIQPEVGQRIAEARALLSAGAAFEVMAFEKRAESRALKVAGTTAQIDITGALTKAPDFWAMLFGSGNTTYGDIQAALAAAASDASVKDVVLMIDSPGGTVDGLFETLSAVRDFRDTSGKKLSVRASRAASAAYAIAAMAGPIEAVSPSAEFGSIGVAYDYYKDPDIGSITNTGSPNKRPDLNTDEGRAVVRAHLDELHTLFITSIASGRGVDVEAVSADFGQGAVFVAAEAKRRKMIDRAPGAVLRAVPGARAADNQQGQITMDITTLMAQHPEVYAAAVQAGVKQERERACAHLKLGEASGAMGIAVTAIKDGSDLNITLQAEYMAAGLNKRDMGNRQGDDAAASAALENTPSGGVVLDMQDRIAARLRGAV